MTGKWQERQPLPVGADPQLFEAMRPVTVAEVDPLAMFDMLCDQRENIIRLQIATDMDEDLSWQVRPEKK